MLRYIIPVALLLTTVPAIAGSNDPATLSCTFQSGEHFTVVGANGSTVIQWDDGKFYQATSAFEKPWLTVAELSAQGNLFKMAFNVETREAYGETTFTDGRKKGGPLFCIFK